MDILKLATLMTTEGFLIAGLGKWVQDVSNGYTYSRLGEPNELIRNVEWVLGAGAIIGLASMIKEELDKS